MKKDQRIDDYINKSAAFARPLLLHFRALVHATCPDVQEKIKWGFPHFDYLDSPLTHMCAFKQHCAIGFWKASLMEDAKELQEIAKSEVAMGHLGKITGMKDLPKDKILKKYIRDAMRLNEEGVKLPARAKISKDSHIEVPSYFQAALKKDKTAGANFKAFRAGQKKEYVNWLEEAKTEATREKRLGTALEWIAENKIRNWKYLKK